MCSHLARHKYLVVDTRDNPDNPAMAIITAIHDPAVKGTGRAPKKWNRGQRNFAINEIYSGKKAATEKIETKGADQPSPASCPW